MARGLRAIGTSPPRITRWPQPSRKGALIGGMAIQPVAETQGLGFLPVAEEHYDFAVWQDPRDPDAVAAFEAALIQSAAALRACGFSVG